MTIDERLEALTMNLELIGRDVEGLRAKAEADNKRIELLITASQQDGENIRGLARIAEIHERRITHLEGE